MPAGARRKVGTGASAGIGLKSARDLASRGARVILACRSKEKGKDRSQLEIWLAGRPGSSSPARARRKVGTEASAGIGLEAARDLASRGARVILAYRSKEKDRDRSQCWNRPGGR